MSISPLRYPGGKARIAPMVEALIKNSPHHITTYYEPFCGGAGIALYLLTNNIVENIAINDFDKAIYSFWRSTFFDTKKLIEKIEKTPISVDEWKNQKEIYKKSTKYSVDFAFATLYLNRTNRSGIISAGPIGGYKQEGEWKIDARYNKQEIIGRIEKISCFKNRVKVNNMDIRHYIKTRHLSNGCFIYFDPPYVNNSKRLYKNSLSMQDHAEIAHEIKSITSGEWIITYDNTDLVRSLYDQHLISQFPIQYSAANKKKERELLIFKDADMPVRIFKYLV